MNWNKAIKIVRQLAKSEEWQTLYNRAKEYNFRLFENDRNFSSIQLEFLSFLSFYSTIEIDISIGEIDRNDLEDETCEEAYILYKMKGKKEENENNTIPNINRGKYEQRRETKNSQWVFKNPKKVFNK